MRDNERCNISHAPSTGLSSIQFSILNLLESLIPKAQKIHHHRDEIGRLLTAATKHLTSAVLNIKIPVNVDPSRATKPNLTHYMNRFQHIGILTQNRVRVRLALQQHE